MVVTRPVSGKFRRRCSVVEGAPWAAESYPTKSNLPGGVWGNSEQYRSNPHLLVRGRSIGPNGYLLPTTRELQWRSGVVRPGEGTTLPTLMPLRPVLGRPCERARNRQREYRDAGEYRPCQGGRTPRSLGVVSPNRSESPSLYVSSVDTNVCPTRSVPV